ncbi:FKBP-type peptidyl-prolyl cis-trans isomerase [Thioalkalivibrio paradoxus]|uniref:Peptidyl-prolyl cis-trans isomerase n=1 Tax=Thioalkalivibrio paradoxus ARh 1 TaxID=713585 RepID=W0DJA1_9GAMM|nr:peptidylprolyl isomerase [Thioalkalivibrio paradoxus]AHE97083.1 peptidylprolyl isomerase [Thioalkalivibrio paradoxus ARh 1]
MTAVTPGSRVTLHYRLVLEQGFVADRSGDEPLEFVLGDGTLEPGLERHLIGLEAGERREIAIAPGTVFPFAVKAAVQVLERAAFPADMPLEPGMIYEFNTPAGDAVPGRIKAVESDAVTVDFNHPLAGQPFTFEVEIVSVEPAAADPATDGEG